MSALSAEGQRIVEDVANKHGVSTDAVSHLLMALAAGGGSQAQFNHPDLGGMGQWSQGGMIMVGDMFNQGLKFRIDSLCTELAGILRERGVFVGAPASSQQQSQSGGGQQQQFGGGFGGQQQSSGGVTTSMGGGMASGASLFVSGGASGMSWWPSELGQPSSTGAQNQLRYAVFPTTRRLAIDNHGQITVYDIGDHQISGFSQQQSGDQSLTFTSQYGLVRVADLPVVQGVGKAAAEQPSVSAAAETKAPAEARKTAPSSSAAAEPVQSTPAPSQATVADVSEDDIFAKIERLAALHAKGILSDDEFNAKKAELLARL
ncbi:MAG: SHOCT domain-containing protein [Geminicoccaceae bacterium]